MVNEEKHYWLINYCSHVKICHSYTNNSRGRKSTGDQQEIDSEQVEENTKRKPQNMQPEKARENIVKICYKYVDIT